MYDEVAKELVSRKNSGIFLDIGTGGGFLLKSLNELNSDLELIVIDISKDMVKISTKNLQQAKILATVLQESIEKTTLENSFFDVATYSASFSYWENPVICLDEIFRMLKTRWDSNFMGTLHRIGSRSE